MSGVVNLSPIETPDLKLSPERQKDVSMFITCWTLAFMFMAIALTLTNAQVSNIAEVGEYLKLCIGLTKVVQGARRRQRGGVDDEEIETAIATVTRNLPPEVDLREKIQKVRGQLVEARARALDKFQKGPSMAYRLVRLLASAGIAFLPIADKLITLGIRLKSEQYKASMAVAAVTGPAQMAAMAVGDGLLTVAVNGAMGADIAFAAVGKAGVEGTQAAAQGVTGAYNWFGQTIKSIQASPGTRAEAEKQAAAKVLSDLEALEEWAFLDANFDKVKAYDNYFNSTADLLSQQPPPALQSGTELKAASETEGAQIVKGIRAKRNAQEQMNEGVKVLAGFKNFMSPFNTYMFMVAHLFRDHTMNYIKWSNVLGMTIAGIVAEDPVTVVLCITWVMSALVGVSYVARLLDALTTQVELNTQVKLQEASAKALELTQLEKELKIFNIESKLARLIADGPGAQGGRRSTSRRRRPAAYLPRRTRRSSSGRRQRSSRRRRE